MTSLRGITALALIAALLLPAGARAQEASPDQALSEIREMALYARYREALEATQHYLERTDLDAAQRNAGLEVLATIHIALRDQTAAAQDLQQLYSRDPEHRLSDPDASPPVLSAFGRARSNPPPPLQVELEHQPPALEARRPPIIDVHLGAGADAVDEVRLHVRQADETRFTTLVMDVSGEGVASARLPVLERSEAYDASYYIEALAPSGAVLASRGTEAEPLSFTMPAASATVAVGENPGTAAGGGGAEDLWWLWTIIGAVVVAGGVVAGYFIAQEVTAPDDGSLDTIQLPLVRF